MMETKATSTVPGPKKEDSARRSHSRKNVRHFLFLGLGFALVFGVWYFREPLRSLIWRNGVLSNDAPPPELVEEMIEHSANRTAAILAVWNTDQIVHRQAALRFISRRLGTEQTLPPELETLARAGALDADMDIREMALGILRERKDPALAALAAAQLEDADPEIRYLGLRYLKGLAPSIGVPTVIPLLDDNDPFIVAMASKLIGAWSKQEFGVKLSETLSFENEKTGLKEFREGSYEKAEAGAARAKAWWAQHRAEFAPLHLEIPLEAIAASKPVRAVDFSLRALDGRKVRLSDLRGKLVLINFWTTWCTACVGEIPELIALQKQHSDQLTIIGVSLDFVPDSHGHIGGHAAVEEQNHPDAEREDHAQEKGVLKKVREKVIRTIKARNINYTILLDEKNEVGGRFNGGELPTTVIVDAQGLVRRRFVGARSLPVFKAMIAEASQPLRPAAEGAKALDAR